MFLGYTNKYFFSGVKPAEFSGWHRLRDLRLRLPARENRALPRYKSQMAVRLHHAQVQDFYQ